MSCCIADDGPEVFREEFRKARKFHSCCECRSDIEPGDMYEYVSGLWDGHWSEYKTCEKCADLRESLNDVTCPYYGGLEEAYTNWLTDGPNTLMAVKMGSHAAKLVPHYFVDPQMNRGE